MTKIIVNATTSKLPGKISYIPTYEVKDCTCGNGKPGVAITI